MELCEFLPDPAGSGAKKPRGRQETAGSAGTRSSDALLQEPGIFPSVSQLFPL